MMIFYNLTVVMLLIAPIISKTFFSRISFNRRYKTNMGSELLSRLCCTGGGDTTISDDAKNAADASAKSSSILSSLNAPKSNWVHVRPGKCQLTAEFTPCKLLERAQVTDTTSILRFSLPDDKEPLNLSTCACILAKVSTMVSTPEENEDGTIKKRLEDVIRPYTPVSTNEQIGSFDLLIRYYDDGKMTQHLKHMKEGDTVDFKHIDPNVKIQAPDFAATYNQIGMIAGGTGITPMIQALHAILGGENNTDASKKTKVVVLYGSRNSADILAVDLLTSWEKAHPERLEVVHVLSNEPNNSSWTGKTGFIDKKLIQEKFAAPGKENDIFIMVCGPPPIYDVFCGPRDRKELTGVLDDLGYNANQVYKF